MFIKMHDEPMPTKEMRERCWIKNDDGAGYAWWSGDEMLWYVHKGFMDYDEFEEGFAKDRKKYDLDNKTVICHFRIGTSGPMDATGTHPFPAMPGEDLEALEYKTRAVFFHNGTISTGSKKLSDTMMACKDWVQPLAHLIWRDKENKDEALFDLLRNDLLKSNSNRYVLAFEDKVWKLGNWVKDDKTNVEYSNSGFKTAPLVQNDTTINSAYTPYNNGWNTGYHSNNQAKYICSTCRKYFTFRDLDLNGDCFACSKKNVSLFRDSVCHDLSGEWAYVTRYLTDDGEFNWDKYNSPERYKATPERVIKEKDKVADIPGDKATEIVPVYDDTGKVIYEITRKVDRKEVDYGITCTSCNLKFEFEELTQEGNCPECGMNFYDRYVCPMCEEEDFILLPEEEIVKEFRKKGVEDYCRCGKCRTIWGYDSSGGAVIIKKEDERKEEIQ